jgi:hypothetical protein
LRITVQAGAGRAVRRGNTQVLHAVFGKRELFGAQRHTRQGRAKFGAGHFGQRAPTAANFQHAVARLDPSPGQCPTHLGGLCLRHGLGQIAVKNGG